MRYFVSILTLLGVLVAVFPVCSDTIINNKPQPIHVSDRQVIADSADDIIENVLELERELPVFVFGDGTDKRNGENQNRENECDDAELDQTAKIREGFVRRLLEEANKLERYRDEFDRKAREYFNLAEELNLPLDLTPGTLWAKGKFYWDWSSEFHDMARKRRHEAVWQWDQISMDYLLTGDEHAAAGRYEDAECYYEKAAHYLNPFVLKPWLIPLLGPGDGLHRETRGTLIETTVKLLKKAADAARSAGANDRAEEYERQRRSIAYAGAEDLETAAKFYDENGFDEEAADLRNRAAILRVVAQGGL